ncbi:MAG: hypothetical protein ACX939_00170 [Hyphococcus sp.]
MRKFFITYSIILGAMILVAGFQLLASSDQLSIGDALSNIQDRWFLFAVVVFGGSPQQHLL